MGVEPAIAGLGPFCPNGASSHIGEVKRDFNHRYHIIFPYSLHSCFLKSSGKYHSRSMSTPFSSFPNDKAEKRPLEICERSPSKEISLQSSSEQRLPAHFNKSALPLVSRHPRGEASLSAESNDFGFFNCPKDLTSAIKAYALPIEKFRSEIINTPRHYVDCYAVAENTLCYLSCIITFPSRELHQKFKLPSFWLIAQLFKVSV